MHHIRIIFLLLFLLTFNIFAQSNTSKSAQGLFLSVGVGPRFPLADFSDKNNIGSGFEAIFSFTDVSYLPIFLYAKFSYQNHSGNYNFYKNSDHSSLTSNLLSAGLGGKYYFYPLIEDVILLMPIIEGGINYSYIEDFHQFKIDFDKKDFLDKNSKFGFHIGSGLSFFLMEVIASYNYLPNNQFVSFDLRLTIPLAATL